MVLINFMLVLPAFSDNGLSKVLFKRFAHCERNLKIAQNMFFSLYSVQGLNGLYDFNSDTVTHFRRFKLVMPA